MTNKKFMPLEPRGEGLLRCSRMAENSSRRYAWCKLRRPRGFEAGVSGESCLQMANVGEVTP